MTQFIPSPLNAKIVRRIADMLNACSIGKHVTHDAITRAAARPAPTIVGLVQRARRLANQETGAVFRTIRGVGYERMAANQAPSLDNQARAHTRRCYRTAATMIGNSLAKANDLSADDVKRGWQAITHLGLLEHMARDKSAPKIPDAALPSDPGHTVKATLEAMRAALGRA